MKHVLGFVVPAATAVAGADTFGQQLIIAGLSGLIGVIGVTIAAVITTRRAEEDRTRVLLHRLRGRRAEGRRIEDE